MQCSHSNLLSSSGWVRQSYAGAQAKRAQCRSGHFPKSASSSDGRANLTAELLPLPRDFAVHDHDDWLDLADLVLRTRQIVAIDDYKVGELAGFDRTPVVLGELQPGRPGRV